jgi:hypothetical protein
MFVKTTMLLIDGIHFRMPMIYSDLMMMMMKMMLLVTMTMTKIHNSSTKSRKSR